MATPTSNNSLSQSRPIKSAGELSNEIGALDGDLAKLKVRFDQHFLGLERKPPTDELERIRRAVMALKRAFTNNTAMKFRIDTLYQKFKSYEQLWTKTLREIEEGTYRKDLMRLRLRNLKKAKVNPDGENGAKSGKKRELVPDFGDDELDAALGALGDDFLPGEKASSPLDDDFFSSTFGGQTPAPTSHSSRSIASKPISQATPTRAFPTMPQQQPPHVPVAFRPTGSGTLQPSSHQPPLRPLSPAPRPNPPSGGSITHDRIDQIYREYVQAKRQCNENTSGITRDALAKSLQEKVRGGNDVKVIIRNGKAMLSLVKKT